MEQTPKTNPQDMSSAAFLNSISEEKIGFFPKVEASQSQGAYFKVSAIGSAYSNPSKIRILGAFIDDSMIEGWRAFNTSGMPMRKKTKDEIDLLYQDGVFKMKNIAKYKYKNAWYPHEDRNS